MWVLALSSYVSWRHKIGTSRICWMRWTDTGSSADKSHPYLVGHFALPIMFLVQQFLVVPGFHPPLCGFRGNPMFLCLYGLGGYLVLGACQPASPPRPWSLVPCFSWPRALGCCLLPFPPRQQSGELASVPFLLSATGSSTKHTLQTNHKPDTLPAGDDFNTCVCCIGGC